MCKKVLFVWVMTLGVFGIAGCDNTSSSDKSAQDEIEPDTGTGSDDTTSASDSASDSQSDEDSGDTNGSDTETVADTESETQLPGCYSPNRNLDIAFETNARGCRCYAEDYPFESVCIDDVPLVCENGAWAAMKDAPCVPPPYDCFSPEHPESVSFVEEGCDCDPEVDEPVCDGKGFVCYDGKWITVIDGPCMEKK